MPELGQSWYWCSQGNKSAGGGPDSSNRILERCAAHGSPAPTVFRQPLDSRVKEREGKGICHSAGMLLKCILVKKNF